MNKTLSILILALSWPLFAKCPSMPKLTVDKKIEFEHTPKGVRFVKLTGVDIILEKDQERFKVFFKCGHGERFADFSIPPNKPQGLIVWNKNRWKGICMAYGKLSNPSKWRLSNKTPYIYSRSKNGGTTGSIKKDERIFSYIREDGKSREKITLMIHKPEKQEKFPLNKSVKIHQGVLKPTSGKWDSSSIAGANPIKMGNEYWLYYRGSEYKNQMLSHIGLAKSSDGIVWEKYKKNPVFKRQNFSWDSQLLADPHVLKVKDGFWMFYSGHNRGSLLSTMEKDQIGLGKQIGLAFSKDGINWQRCFNKAFINKNLKSDNVFAMIKGQRLLVWFRTMNENHGFGGELWYHEYQL